MRAVTGAGAGAARAGFWRELPTPAAVLTSEAGIPHFTLRDALVTLPTAETSVVGARLSHLYPVIMRAAAEATPAARDLASACGLTAHVRASAAADAVSRRRTWLTVRDTGEGDAWKVEANDSQVTIPTMSGRRKVGVDEYTVAALALRPDALTVCHDEAPGGSVGNNRARAICSRAVSWLDRTLALFRQAAGEAAPSVLATEGAGSSRGGDADGDGGDSGSEAAAPSAAKRRRVEASAAAASPSAAAAADDAPLLPAALRLPAGGAASLPQLFAFVPVVRDAALMGRTCDAIVSRCEAANARPHSSAAAPPPLVAGISIGGIFLGEAREVRLAALEALMPRIPPHYVRAVAGCITPLDALECIAAGVDVIDSSYTLALTRRRLAAAFEPAIALLDAVAVGGSTTAAAGGSSAGPTPAVWLDMADKAHAMAFEPLSSTCRCFACAGACGEADVAATVSSWATGRAADGGDAAGGAASGSAPSAPLRSRGHWRAYLHHLVVTTELLAWVLLQVHNVWQMAAFMAAVRRLIERGGDARAAAARLAEVLPHAAWALPPLPKGGAAAAAAGSIGGAGLVLKPAPVTSGAARVMPAGGAGAGAFVKDFGGGSR